MSKLSLLGAALLLSFGLYFTHKKVAVYIFLLLAICLATCKRDDARYSQDQLLITNAEHYFTDNITTNNSTSTISNERTTMPKLALWGKAYIMELSVGKTVIVPIQYSKMFYVNSNIAENSLYSINEIAYLAIFKDARQNWHAQMITAFPDSTYENTNRRQFTGLLFVDDWFGNPITKYKYEANNVIRKYVPGTNNMTKGSLSQSKNFKEGDAVTSIFTTTCYEIEGYNYSPDLDESYYWEEDGGCSTSYIEVTSPDNGSGGLSGGDYGSIPGGGGGSVGGPGPIVPADFLIMAGGNSPIANIQDYNKCFTNIGGSDISYQVTVAVDQPDPGTRNPWGFSGGGSSATGNPVNVGHTFLILTESYGGTTITRNVGFYPQSSVNPLHPSAQGQLNNDQSHIYNISLTITVTNAEFFEILNYIDLGNNTGFMYNINSDNCTTFALAALASAGIDLPRTIGSWPNGGGLDPGDLGEDIRAMDLSSDMVRNTVDNAHPNMGTCN